MPSGFVALIEKIATEANARGQIGSLAHVYVHCLEQTALCESEPVLAAVALIRAKIIPHTRKNGRRKKSETEYAFDPDAARSDFQSFWTARAGPRDASDRVLLWLLEGGFEDGTQANCRIACTRNGVIRAFLFPKSDNTAPDALGFGQRLDAEWAAGSAAACSAARTTFSSTLDFFENH